MQNTTRFYVRTQELFVVLLIKYLLKTQHLSHILKIKSYK